MVTGRRRPARGRGGGWRQALRRDHRNSALRRSAERPTGLHRLIPHALEQKALLGRVGGVIHRPLSWPTRFEEDHVYRWELTSPQTSADLCGYWELLRPDLAVSEQDNGRFGAHPGARPTVELQWRTRHRASTARQRDR